VPDAAAETEAETPTETETVTEPTPDPTDPEAPKPASGGSYFGRRSFRTGN